MKNEKRKKVGGIKEEMVRKKEGSKIGNISFMLQGFMAVA